MRLAERLVRRTVRLLPKYSRLRAQAWLDARTGAVDVELRRLAEFLPGERRKTALDIGANNGVTACVLSKAFERVLAFEPNPELVAEWMDVAPGNVVVFPYALSDADGQAELRIPTVNGQLLPGWASLGAGGLENADAFKNVEIEKRRLDTLLADQCDVDFVKIDVEGHELAVLEGGASCFEKWRPWFVVEAWENCRADLKRWFEDHGYTQVHLKELIGEAEAPQNLVFRPAERGKAPSQF